MEIFGIVFTVIVGTLLHFTYEWSGRSLLISFLAPTNESVFEHLKLLATPYVLFALNEYVHYGQFVKNFISAKTAGLVAGMLFMVLFFYAYTFIAGRNFLVVDISLFIASVCVAYGASHILMQIDALGTVPIRLLSYCLCLSLLLVFLICSVCPPQHSLFSDPFPFPRKPLCK